MARMGIDGQTRNSWTRRRQTARVGIDGQTRERYKVGGRTDRRAGSHPRWTSVAISSEMVLAESGSSEAAPVAMAAGIGQGVGCAARRPHRLITAHAIAANTDPHQGGGRRLASTRLSQAGHTWPLQRRQPRHWCVYLCVKRGGRGRERAGSGTGLGQGQGQVQVHGQSW